MQTILTPLSLILFATIAFADATAHCDKEFSTGFLAGGKLSIHVRPGDTDIAGADVSTVRVTCTTSHTDEDLSRISIHFHATGTAGELRIEGGGSNNTGAHFRIEVPRRTNLYVRSNAGNMKVADVSGDTDVELYAGNLTISIGEPKNYRHADASVVAGNLDASAFNVAKDGVFRSFSQDNPKGKYKLHAHLMAGDLTLR